MDGSSDEEEEMEMDCDLMFEFDLEPVTKLNFANANINQNEEEEDDSGHDYDDEGDSDADNFDHGANSVGFAVRDDHPRQYHKSDSGFSGDSYDRSSSAQPFKVTVNNKLSSETSEHDGNGTSEKGDWSIQVHTDSSTTIAKVEVDTLKVGTDELHINSDGKAKSRKNSRRASAVQFTDNTITIPSVTDNKAESSVKNQGRRLSIKPAADSESAESQPKPEQYKRRKSIIKELPGIVGSRPMMLQKRLRAAVAKAKERGDPWKKFHIEELPGQLATRYRYNAKKSEWVEDQVWSEVYNRMSPPKQIDIFQMCVIRMQEGGQLYHVEHFIEGEYIKYNSNSGFVDEHMRHTPHAFSHFTFEHSGHKLIVVDIQGVGDLYTDPQIHTSEGTEYGDGNLGTKGMALFFHSHLCNPICDLLKLSKFDLSETELAEIKNGSSKCMSPATTVINPNRRNRCSSSISSLSPASEHAEKQFSFDNTSIFNVPSSPIKRSSRPGSMSQSPTDADNRFGCRRLGHQDSLSIDVGSPNDEHFEALLKCHRPSTVNGIEDIAKLMESLESESVLGKIHFELAKYHELGRFINEGEIDAESALFHLDIAAQLENGEATKCLAQIYLQRENDVLPSVSVVESEENTNKGIDYMIQSAQKGDRNAQVYMAKAFETGFGLGTSREKDWRESALYYEMAINSPSGGCVGTDEPSYKLMASLANLYQLGGFQLEKDPSQAGDLYNEAAETAMAEFKGSLATKYFELAELAWAEMEEE
ncbi:eukaryotic elongation factor 2 kinase-like isoform X2 [Convolutriloba macropyga]|uniref:eukaryotic elongation factor 2 kinase-like isoform X2 n=1 Tax=Convolutriloba macropyga TaxID=536237 RepID=UPI003F51E492